MDLRSYTKHELALLYFPDATPAVASAHLMRWIQRIPDLLQKLAATGYGKNCKESPRCKSPTSSTSSVSPNPVPPNLKMSQQKENKDINSILAKTSKKHFREKKRLFL